MSYQDLLRRRTDYDEFILYVDREFGRFYNSLEASGLLENTWVVLTSDHGEMFERGISAHSTEALYEPVIRIPLMIFEPGRESRYGHPRANQRGRTCCPRWRTSRANPSRRGQRAWSCRRSRRPTQRRHVFVVRAAKNDPSEPLRRASTAMIRERYKLLYFFGYPEKGIDELVRLYDLQTDPEELTDLATAHADIAQDMLRELKGRIQESDQPYR